MIKCACGDPKCKTEINFDSASSALLFTDKEGRETLMYLDPNTIKEFVSELRQVLNYQVFEKESA
jgi:hypothetical protein